MIDREDSSGTATPNQREVVYISSKSSNDLTVTRGVNNSTARSHNDAAKFEPMITVGFWSDFYTAYDNEHTVGDGSHDITKIAVLSGATIQMLTSKILSTPTIITPNFGDSIASNMIVSSPTIVTPTFSGSVGSMILSSPTIITPTITALSGARAYLGNAQNSTSAGVIVALDTETYDLNTEFDVSTYKFTAEQAGYYLTTGSVRWQTTVDQNLYAATIRKNGGDAALGYKTSSGTGQLTVKTTDIIYLNGTTDYLTLFAVSDSTLAMAVDGTATYMAIMKIG